MTYDPIALGNALTIMWQGMLGIFAVMGVITLLVWCFTKFGGKK